MPQYVFKYVGVDSDGDLGILSRRLPLEQITALRTGERAAASGRELGNQLAGSVEPSGAHSNTSS